MLKAMCSKCNKANFGWAVIYRPICGCGEPLEELEDACMVDIRDRSDESNIKGFIRIIK